MKFNLKFWSSILFYLMVFALGFSAGAYFGIIMFVDHITYGAVGIFEGSNINFDLNETKLVNEFNKTIIPELKKEVGTSPNGK